MALTPTEITQQVAQAEEAFKDKDYNQSVSLLTSIIQENPDYAPAYVKLGYIWMRTGTPQKALSYFSKAVNLAPKSAENWIALGRYYQKANLPIEALKAFSKSLTLSGENAAIRYELFGIQHALKDNEAALASAEKLVEMEPDNVTYLWEYAKMLEATGDTREALKYYNVLLGKEEADISTDMLNQWYKLMILYGHSDEVYGWLDKKLRANPYSARMKWFYGKIMSDDFRYDEALVLVKEAYGIDPENATIASSLATLYDIVGDKENARHYYEKALHINPIYALALRSAGVYRKYDYGDTAFKRLNFATAYLPKMSIKEKANLYYALGKAYDDVGELPTAFEYYKKGGICHANGDNSEFETLSRIESTLKVTITPDTFKNSNTQGFRSKKSVFVLGMPRSGTTLIEQVLSGLDGVFGAGELSYVSNALNGMMVEGNRLRLLDRVGIDEKYSPTPKECGEHYLSLTEAIAPEGSKRIIDKMPYNFKFVGPIHLMLPDAQIIHSRRHPVETCISAYRLHFAQGHHWSDDLRTMGKYYRKYHSLMEHWKETMPRGTILEVRYEDMIRDLEAQSKRLAEYIGMKWDPSCMKFYRSKRAVKTASANQVRQPIYKTSVNRWRKYKPYLKPLLDEIWDLVEIYEAELNNSNRLSLNDLSL